MFSQGHVGEADLQGLAAIRWGSMDTWYEEVEEVFVHPHDPYHRIDVLRSSRKIQVMIEDAIVAETSRPVMLLETGCRSDGTSLRIMFGLISWSGATLEPVVLTKDLPNTIQLESMEDWSPTWPGTLMHRFEMRCL